jgi:uncharacterized protein (TIGR02302 family)
MSPVVPAPGPAGGRPDRAIGVKLYLARAALAWERLWPALWPAVAVAALFLALALFDTLPALGGWLHSLVLVGFLGGLALALWRGLRRVALPGDAAARRRLETASGLPHRPLEALDDNLAGGRRDPVAEALWQAHRRRLLAGLARLRIGVPAPGLPRRDRIALRAGLALVLAVAIAAAGGDWRQRLARALGPDFSPIAAALPASLDIWIAPPAYTGLPPVFLHSGASGTSPQEADQPAAATAATGAIVVPAGSTLLAQLNGGFGAAVLRLGGRQVAFEQVDRTSHNVTTELSESGAVTVEQGGRTLGRWQVEVVPDAVPSIAFLTPPARTQRAALRLEYTAEDDFGLTGVRAVITRVEPSDMGPAVPDEIVLELTLPGRHLKQAEDISYHDLTAHVWAGLAVDIRLEATDGIDQKGVSEPFRTVLPERIFNHPVARAIVEQRKQLSLDPAGNREAVAEVLHDLSLRPKHYYDDIVVFLALTSASHRLLNDGEPEAIGAVQRLLWDTALRIEDGSLSIAERRLREAEQRLMEALANEAEDEEIERLMDELQAALDEYLQALAEELARQQQAGPLQQPIDPQAVMLDRLDLQQMIEQARKLARSGAREAARQLLSQLREMLENLRSGAMAQMDQQSRDAWRMMQDLQDLINRQHELLDDTFRQSRQSPPNMQGQQGGPDKGPPDRGRPGQRGQPGAGEMPGQPGRGAGRQQRLRYDLGDLVRRLDELTGDIPRAFGRADRSMRQALEALRRGQPGQAVGPQTDALDQLQQGARALSEQMMQQMRDQMAATGMQGPGRQQQLGRDPFGRPMPNGLGVDTSDVRIPGEAELQRAREILDELRRRAGDRHRPTIELDYIDRLLRRF